MTLNNSVLKAIIILGMSLASGTNEKDVLKQLTTSVGKRFNKCQGVMNYPPIVLSDFLNYWNGQHLVQYNTGCAIICVAYELHLLDPYGNVHIPNARGFLMSGGAEEPMLNSMSDLLRECMLTVIPKKIKDVCNIALEFANCFRIGIKERGWTPDLTDLMQVETRRTDNPNKIVNYKRPTNKTNLIQGDANSTFDAASFQERKIYGDLLKDNQTTKYAEDHVTAKTNMNLQSISGSKENNKPENQVEKRNETTLPEIKKDKNRKRDKKDSINGTEMTNDTK